VSRAETGAALAAVAFLLPAPAAAQASQPEPSPPTDRVAWVARLLEPVTALDGPATGHIVGRLAPVTSWNRGPVMLLVLDTSRDDNGDLWLRVLLPRRPNGTSAWIRADTAQLGRTRWRIEISTEQRTVTVFHRGVRVRSFPAVVGAPATPTPHGRFALYDRVRLTPNNFLGTWAIHLTGFSDVLATFDGGQGQLALHGRGGASLRDPLGSARSHGCIRITNAAIGFIATHAPLGTPVLVR